jgi:hypothetical protein
MQSISEPAPLNRFLLDAGCLDHDTSVRVVRALVRTLGRPRHSGSLQFVLKTSSWNLRHHALFRAAFPEAPMIWVHRAPGEILASLLRTPSFWMGEQDRPGLSEALFGISAAEAGRLGREEYCAKALAALVAAGLSAEREGVLAIDHADLPEAVWTRLVPLLELAIDEGVVESMREIARFDAKAPGQVPFCAVPARLSEARRRLLDGCVEPLYARIGDGGQRAV